MCSCQDGTKPPVTFRRSVTKAMLVQACGMLLRRVCTGQQIRCALMRLMGYEQGRTPGYDGERILAGLHGAVRELPFCRLLCAPMSYVHVAVTCIRT